MKDNGSSGSEMGRTYSLRGKIRNSNKIVAIKLEENDSWEL
jgi:hypothetical protein